MSVKIRDGYVRSEQMCRATQYPECLENRSIRTFELPPMHLECNRVMLCYLTKPQDHDTDKYVRPEIMCKQRHRILRSPKGKIQLLPTLAR
jgi:hypothetical protein